MQRPKTAYTLAGYGTKRIGRRLTTVAVYRTVVTPRQRKDSDQPVAARRAAAGPPSPIAQPGVTEPSPPEQGGMSSQLPTVVFTRIGDRDYVGRRLGCGFPAGRLMLHEVLRRDAGRCGICGEPVRAEDLSFDHILPVRLGGCHCKDNLRVAHLVCNMRRNDCTLVKINPCSIHERQYKST